MNLYEPRINIDFIEKKKNRLTLGSFLNPLIDHSLTLGGLSMQHILACWIHGSLMMLTVNSFVALMFLTVSLSVDEDEKDMTGGEADTCGYTDDLLFKIVLRAGLYANLIKPAVDREIKNFDKLYEYIVSEKSPEWSEIFNPILRYRRNKSNGTRSNTRNKNSV